MRKQILLITVITALVVATLGIATAFAMADTPAPTAGLTTITPDYNEWGALLALAAYGDEIAVVHRQDERVYLCVWGDTVDITDRIHTTDDRIQMVMTADGVLLYTGGDTMTVYTPTGLADTAVPCGYKESLSTRPFTAMAVDDGTVYGQPTLYVGYGTLIVRIAWAEALAAANSPEFTQRVALVAEVDNATHSYQRMGWHDGGLYMYGNDSHFTVRPLPDDALTGWQIAPTVAVPAMQRYVPFADGIALRDGVPTTADTAEAIVAADAEPDAQIAQGVEMTSAAGGAYLAVADNRATTDGVVHGAVKLYDTHYRLVRMLGDYGAIEGKFNAPDAVAAQQLTLVRDAGNRRVVVYNPTGEMYGALPITGDNLLCATTGNHVYVGQGQLVTLYTCDSAITSVAVFNLPEAQVVSLAADEEGAYALTDDGKLYWLQLAASQPVVKDSGMTCADVIEVKAGKHTGVLYLRNKQGQVRMYKDKQAVDLVFALPPDCLAWDVDYCGNLYALCADGVTVSVYRRTTEGYGLESVTLADAVVSLAISQDGVVYATRRHALLAVDMAVRSRNNAAYQHPSITAPVRAVRIEGVGTVWGYTSPDNYESVVGIVGGSCAMLIAPHTYLGQDYYYIEYTVRTDAGERHEKVYVPQTRAILLDEGQPDVTRVRYNGVDAQTGVYAYPGNSAQPIAQVAAEEAQWDVVRIVGMDGTTAAWPWYEIVYGQGTAYVRMVNYVSVQPANPVVPRYYAHAKANRLGESVLVYRAPDTDSEVLATLVDGSSIELVAPFDKNQVWTTVRYEGQEAYVLTANISTGGLTNGQLFAVIMTVVAVCAAAVTILLYCLAKRRK